MGGLTVAFFGLGDKSFEIFNGGCKKMRTAMVDRCGAKELLEPTYGDTGGDNPSGRATRSSRSTNATTAGSRACFPSWTRTSASRPESRAACVPNFLIKPLIPVHYYYNS